MTRSDPSPTFDTSTSLGTSLRLLPSPTLSRAPRRRGRYSLKIVPRSIKQPSSSSERTLTRPSFGSEYPSTSAWFDGSLRYSLSVA